MEQNGSGLKSIAMEYLFEGMELGEDVFSFDGSVLLLGRGNTLTRQNIERLKRFNADNHNITVHEETYRALIEHGLPDGSTLAQAHLEEQTGYTGIKNEAGTMLSDIKSKNSVSRKQTDKICGEMSATLNSVDPSLIFQCINGPNPISEYLSRHSVNVGMLNGLIGKWLGLPEESVNMLVLAGLVHDVGKTRIPTEILDAPRKLSSLEFSVVKAHPLFSYDLLHSGRQFPEEVMQAARYHHEKMNGNGYPDGLVADQIPLFARITAVSDVYDAMISKRVYKDARNPFAVIRTLAERQFSDLDTHIVRVFTDHMPNELVGKSVLLSDGSIAVVKYLVPGDLEHPLVSVNGEIIKTSDTLYCKRLIMDA